MKHLTAQETRALQLFKERMLEAFPSRGATLQLFGSKARGEASKHSDVDVIVVMDTVSLDDRMTVSGIVLDIMLETGVLLSVKKFSVREMHKMREGRALFWQAISPDLVAL